MHEIVKMREVTSDAALQPFAICNKVRAFIFFSHVFFLAIQSTYFDPVHAVDYCKMTGDCFEARYRSAAGSGTPQLVYISPNEETETFADNGTRRGGLIPGSWYIRHA